MSGGPVLIAGGGLVLILMLHARGVACAVLEAATDTRPLGVGINVLPHSGLFNAVTQRAF